MKHETPTTSIELATLANATVIGLREATISAGIPRLSDFAAAMELAYYLLADALAGKGPVPDLVESAFRDAVSEFAEHFKEAASAAGSAVAVLRRHRLGAVNMDPAEMQTTAALGAIAVLHEVAEEYGLQPRQQLDLAACAIMAAIIAAAPEDRVEAQLDETAVRLRAEAVAWERAVPTHAEMFGG